MGGGSFVRTKHCRLFVCFYSSFSVYVSDSAMSHPMDRGATTADSFMTDVGSALCAR